MEIIESMGARVGHQLTLLFEDVDDRMFQRLIEVGNDSKKFTDMVMQHGKI